MVSEEIKLPNIEKLSNLSGLPEGMMANDMIDRMKNELVRMGKPEKEAAEITKNLMEAFSKEREKAVEACYLAGYLKGMSDMAQRFNDLVESREKK